MSHIFFTWTTNWRKTRESAFSLSSDRVCCRICSISFISNAINIYCSQFMCCCISPRFLIWQDSRRQKEATLPAFPSPSPRMKMNFRWLFGYNQTKSFFFSYSSHNNGSFLSFLTPRSQKQAYCMARIALWMSTFLTCAQFGQLQRTFSQTEKMSP